jgi:P27 family predicted phage terminase small subunit
VYPTEPTKKQAFLTLKKGIKMSHKKHESDKKAAGTYRAGDKKHLGEALTTLPKAPFLLNDEAYKIFVQEAAALIEQGLLKQSDVRLLALYANEMSIYIDQSAKAEANGVIVTMPNGIACTSPHRKVAAEAFKLASAMSDKLGLSAISRSRMGIKSIEPPQKPDPFAEFLSN